MRFVSIGFNYELGILKVSNEWSVINEEGDEIWMNPGIKNKVMSITVAYLFDVTKDKKKKP